MNALLKKVTLLLFTIFVTYSLFAQNNYTFKGVVKDASQKPLEGVTVAEKNSSNTVLTKADGSFTIISKNKALVLVRKYYLFRRNMRSI